MSNILGLYRSPTFPPSCCAPPPHRSRWASSYRISVPSLSCSGSASPPPLSRSGRTNCAACDRCSSRRGSATKFFSVCGARPNFKPGGSDLDEGRDAETVFGVEGEKKRSVESGLVEEGRENPGLGAEASVRSKVMDILDLEKQFSFYGAYHSNKVNVFIHILFVWPIFYTSLILWAYTAPLAPVPLAAGTLPLQEYMVLNWSFVQAAIYALYYVALDKKAGSLGALICLGCWVGANAVAHALPWSLSWKIVLASQVTCWFFQIFGHQKFEGRAPALLDNLPQAFLMAPFFVLLECLQEIGYEPYPGFRKKVEKNVDDAIREFKQSKAKKVA